MGQDLKWWDATHNVWRIASDTTFRELLPGKSDKPENYTHYGPLPTDATLQDSPADTLDVPFARAAQVPVATTSETLADQYDIDVSAGHTFIVGDKLFMATTSDYYLGTVTAVVTNALTMDTPIDKTFPIGSVIIELATDMAVDGSSTPVPYVVSSGATGDITYDVTRIILTMTTVTQPAWELFGDLTALTNGIVLRKYTNGTYHNIFNAKSNHDLASLAYDMDFLDSIKFGVYGLKMRMTFGSQAKHGVVIRLAPGDRLELIVQDDIDGLVDLSIMAQGSVTVGEDVET